MRLLHIDTWELREFYNNPPKYAIASHRWDSDELTYQDISQRIACGHKSGHKKILNFCNAVKKLYGESPWIEQPAQWLWIDTVCIDKTNSVELQEALNSMFRWYQAAEVCLAWLSDVCSLNQPPSQVLASFHGSIWFTRGWTLQELLAPQLVVFFNCNWEAIGHKLSIGVLLSFSFSFSSRVIGGISDLNNNISVITNIPRPVLWDFSKADDLSIEEKQCWMKNRATTRVEDMFYCQLGIFGVFMPLIYGEGEHAMIRFEEAIEQKARRMKTQPKKFTFSVAYSAWSPSEPSQQTRRQIFKGRHNFTMREDKTVDDLTSAARAHFDPENKYNKATGYRWHLVPAISRSELKDTDVLALLGEKDFNIERWQT